METSSSLRSCCSIIHLILNSRVLIPPPACPPAMAGGSARRQQAVASGVSSVPPSRYWEWGGMSHCFVGGVRRRPCPRHLRPRYFGGWCKAPASCRFGRFPPRLPPVGELFAVSLSVFLSVQCEATFKI